MKKFLSFSSAIVLLAGCATDRTNQASYGYDTNRVVMTKDGTFVYEPAGAQRNPNPNWDLNARGINQQPYGVGPMTWGAPGTGVYTSSDSDKNVGPQYRPGMQVP